MANAWFVPSLILKYFFVKKCCKTNTSSYDINPERIWQMLGLSLFSYLKVIFVQKMLQHSNKTLPNHDINCKTLIIRYIQNEILIKGLCGEAEKGKRSAFKAVARKTGITEKTSPQKREK